MGPGVRAQPTAVETENDYFFFFEPAFFFGVAFWATGAFFAAALGLGATDRFLGAALASAAFARRLSTVSC